MSNPESVPPIPVTGKSPVPWLRLEGLALLITAAIVYRHGHHSWILFALLFLTPDVSFAGYLAGPRIGAICYNTLHSYFSALLLAAILWITHCPLAIPIIWIAHIGFDRAMGYGLKYSSGFGDTHLGRLGKSAKREV
jgi:hypothetical protein